MQITFHLDEAPMLGFERLAPSETAVTFQVEAEADGMRILNKTLLDRSKVRISSSSLVLSRTKEPLVSKRYPHLDSSKVSTSKGPRKISQAAPITGPYLLASDSGSSAEATVMKFPPRLPSTIDPSATSTIVLPPTAITATETSLSAHSNGKRNGKENDGQRRAEVVAAGIATSSRSGSGGSSSSNNVEAVKEHKTSGRTPRQMQDKMATKTPLEPLNSGKGQEKRSALDRAHRDVVEEEEQEDEEKSPSQNLKVVSALTQITRTKSIVIVIASDSDSELSSIEEMSESEPDVRKASARVNSKVDRKNSETKMNSKKMELVEEVEDFNSQVSEPVTSKQRKGKAGKKIAVPSKVTRKSTERPAKLIAAASDAERSQDIPSLRTTRARAAKLLETPSRTANIPSKRKVIGLEATKSILTTPSTQVTDSLQDLTEPTIDRAPELPRKRQRLSDPSPIDPAGASGTSLLETQPSYRAHTLEAKRNLVSPKRTYGKKREQAKTMPIVEIGAGIKRANGRGRSAPKKGLRKAQEDDDERMDLETVEGVEKGEKALRNEVADNPSENLRNGAKSKNRVTTKAAKSQIGAGLKMK